MTDSVAQVVLESNEPLVVAEAMRDAVWGPVQGVLGIRYEAGEWMMWEGGRWRLGAVW